MLHQANLWRGQLRYPSQIRLTTSLQLNRAMMNQTPQQQQPHQHYQQMVSKLFSTKLIKTVSRASNLKCFFFHQIKVNSPEPQVSEEPIESNDTIATGGKNYILFVESFSKLTHDTFHLISLYVLSPNS